MPQLPRPAQYLLRVDDLCPTTKAERWSAIRDLIEQFKIRPILAVVPDNQDIELKKSPPDQRFWEKIRAMQEAGATIALHGYRHRCELRGKSLLPLHRRSEFAGRPLKEQRDQIRSGIELLQGRGLTPRLFVAPNHGFDRVTLQALREECLPFLSDGFARIPFVRGGVTWIPQQLWGPVRRPSGLWTICIHPDSTGDRRLTELAKFLKRHARQFTSFEEVVASFPAKRLGVAERLREELALWRVVLRLRRSRGRA